MLGKPASEASVLFIPTAANSNEAYPAAGACFAELLASRILPNNIQIYDMDGMITPEQAMSYDAVYVTGGSTSHLLRRMKETGFDQILKKMRKAKRAAIAGLA